MTRSLKCFLAAWQLPGNDVGVMLHGGDDDLIALAQELIGKGCGHQIEPFGGSSGEYYLAYRPCIDELTHRFAGSLVQVSGLAGSSSERRDARWH